MTDTATLQMRLAEAEDALHRLLTGAAEVSVTIDGRSVTFAKADEGRLRGYIQELKCQLGQAVPRRPFGVRL